MMTIPVPIHTEYLFQSAAIEHVGIPFIGLNFSRCNSSTAGIRNASVLPEPVLAAPRTSFPARRTGIDFACTGVIVVNSISARALLVCSERSSVENGSLSSSFFVLFAGVADIGVDDELGSAAIGTMNVAGKSSDHKKCKSKR
jgi:hypothetical protein